MSKLTSKLTLLVLPDGPISFDGSNYKYSKGERLYLDNLAKDFKEVQLATFVLRDGDEFFESVLHSSFNSKNIKIIELPGPRFKYPGVIMKAFQFLKVFIRLLFVMRHVDVCYLFLPSYPSALAWGASKIWRKPHIVYGADDWVQASESMFRWKKKKHSFFYKAYAKLNEKMERSIVRTAAFGVAAGGQLVEKYQSFGCASYPTTPRMTLSPRDIYEREDTCLGDYVELINVGGLIHDKAQDQLLKSFAIALKQHKNLKLKLIGEGPEKENLILLAKNLSITSKVNFVGYVEEESVLYDYLHNADVFVLSSVTEGFPRVLYEAMCMRLPIVTTNVGGIPYLMKHNKNALIVKSGDIEQLADAICNIVQDSDLRRRLIREGSRTLDTAFGNIDSSQISKLLKLHFVSN
ncbi:MAG: glycosyltransferase [Pseudohongiellaceae bacterium]